MTQPQFVAQVFIYSTFRDFGEELDLLVQKVFPGLRARLARRFVELVDVDLGWGSQRSDGGCQELRVSRA